MTAGQGFLNIRHRPNCKQRGSGNPWDRSGVGACQQQGFYPSRFISCNDLTVVGLSEVQLRCLYD